MEVKLPLKHAQYASIHNLHKGRKATTKIPEEEKDEFLSLMYNEPIIYEYLVNKGTLKEGDTAIFSTGTRINKRTTNYIGERARVAPVEVKVESPKAPSPPPRAKSPPKSPPKKKVESENGGVAPAPILEAKPKENPPKPVVSEGGGVSEIPVLEAKPKGNESPEWMNQFLAEGYKVVPAIPLTKMPKEKRYVAYSSSEVLVLNSSGNEIRDIFVNLDESDFERGVIYIMKEQRESLMEQVHKREKAEEMDLLRRNPKAHKAKYPYMYSS